MASGVEWTDGYNDIQSDFNRSLTTPTVEQLGIMGRRPRLAEPGERLNYNSGETHLVATVLRAAIGNNLATYLSNKIWGPFGMEFDANWMLVEEDGGEHGGCCISSTLRDYGRLGLLAMRGGVLPNGGSVLVDGWMDESTTPSAANRVRIPLVAPKRGRVRGDRDLRAGHLDRSGGESGRGHEQRLARGDTVCWPRLCVCRRGTGRLTMTDDPVSCRLRAPVSGSSM